MLEYSMIPYEIGGFCYERYDDCTTEGGYLFFLSSVNVQKLADDLGDGFYEENYTVIEGLEIANMGSGRTTIASGQIIPILKRQIQGNLGIIFTSNNDIDDDEDSGEVIANIYDLGSETFLNYVCLQGTNIYCHPQQMGILNAGPNGKMIMAGNHTEYYMGGLVFLNNAIIGNDVGRSTDTQKIFTVNIPLNGNITIDTTSEYNYTKYPRASIQLSPIYSELYPEETYPGVYIMARDTGSLERKQFSKNGITYFTPGNTLNGDVPLVPPIVLSDEYVNNHS